MASDSVGQIGLDLVVNDQSFKQQMAGIQGIAKKAGLALAAAFSVKKLIDFGKQCIDLGSDLAEVQNVVDVTFPRMQKKVNEFAQNAVKSFGLSETMAKRYTGTFGAMSKAFGFGEKAAYDMSTTLTGLAGDVASFYNISQDEAYTKLKSVFTGETESLKDLGVVMTQTALDSFALANGFGKTTANMSEMEKVALRYQFVQDKLNTAAGDFNRTSDGWANQVRILQLQFDSLKATIGQGLINALAPVIKVINMIIGKLMSLANAFKAFTEMFAGKSNGGSSVASAAADMKKLADSAANAEAATSGAGSAAKKAAMDIKGIATGIDELNIIQPPDESGSDGGGSTGGYAADEFAMGEIDTSAIDDINSKCQALLGKIRELAVFFKTGFQVGFGDFSVLNNIQDSLHGIKRSFADIFAAPEVLAAANRFYILLAYNLGKMAGAMASIGATIADNLLGGIDRCLKEHSGRIKEFLITMFDVGSDVVVIEGRLLEALSRIFFVFRSDEAKQITADLIEIFLNGFMGITMLAGSFGRDLLDLIAKPIINNTQGFKEALGGILKVVQTVTSSISETFQKLVDGILNLYDKHIKPLIQSVRDGFDEIVSAVLEAFLTNILPVIQNAADQFKSFNEESLQPLIDKFLVFVGKVSDCIREAWETILRPFVLWFVENVSPMIGLHLQIVIDAFFSVLKTVSEVVSKVLDALDALIDFVSGTFTGDWKKAWTAIKQFFSSIWEAMKLIMNSLLSEMYQILINILSAISDFWTAIWTKIKDFVSQTWENIKNTISVLIDNIHSKIAGTMETIKSGISNALSGIKKTWVDVWDGLKQKTEEIFNNIWSTIKGIINCIIGGVERMANSVISAINGMIEAVNEVADAVPGIDADLIPTIPKIQLPRLAQGGFVKANTPQLAVIGDNRHYGEIVAPEDKMQEMVNRAAALASASNGMNEQYLQIMIDLLKQIITLIENLDLVVNIDIREIRKKLKEMENRSGYSFV